MTADERIARLRVKTKRANKHIDHLEIAMRAFFKRNPYKVRAERDPETGQPSYTLIDCEDIPTPISAIAGDAVQNLRSALDHLAYMLVFIGTKGAGVPISKKGKPRADPFSHIYFPIYDSATKYKSERSSKVQGMSKAAINAIDAFEPYQGGDDLFWQLDQLNNVDKHRLLIDPVAKPYIDLSAIFQSDADDLIASNPLMSQWAGHPDMRLPPIWFNLGIHAVKKGDVFLTDRRPGAEVNQDMASHFVIAFSEPKVLEGKAVLKTLREMHYLVDNVINGLAPFLA